MTRGLQVIASRTDSLSRFTGASPGWRGCRHKLAPVVLGCSSNGCRRSTPGAGRVRPTFDRSRRRSLEQLLINLLRTAADACLGGSTNIRAGGGRK